jgi:hypothetical protein
MITLIVQILRPVCVASTIAMAALIIGYFWGWQPFSGDTFWKLFLSYVALMICSTLICYIDNPRNLRGGRE